MDRFKFRVWSDGDDEPQFVSFNQLVKNDHELHPASYATVEQCTGLKDKNGTLIYEGDIVECWFQETNLRYAMLGGRGVDRASWEGWSGSEEERGDGDDVWLHSKHVGRVEWSQSSLDPGFLVKGERGVWYGPMGAGFDFDDLLVIGNVHENSELLD